MSKIKIFGKPNPVVGVKEYYSVNDFFGKSPSWPVADTPLNIVNNEQIKWSIWVLIRGSWVRMSENNKTGATVAYTFTQKSLTRKGIRMLVEANGEKAMLDILPQKASEGKILHVDLLDANYNKPSRPFAYGDYIIARVHCVDMELLQVKVSLWEDDGDKQKQNTTNVKIETKKGNVLNGKSDISFYLNPSHAWLANVKLAKGDKDEGKFHEYYVTAEIFEKISYRVASKNTNVPNPDYKPKPAHAPKKQTPAEKKGLSKKETKGIAKSENKVHDYHEQKVTVKSTISSNPIWDQINSMMKVDMSPWGDGNDKKGTCPNCDKAVTVADLKQIFTKADDAKLKKVAETYTKYMKDLAMNTCWNKAHLFAQARIESGLSLELKEGEGFNYYYESLSIFKAFQTKEGKEKAILWGRPTIKPKLPGVSLENQKKIANWAYSPPAKKAKEIGNTEANDGWNYRGRGLVQVTGKAFYEYCNLYTKKNDLDVVKKPDLIGQNIELSILSSMIFFKWKNLNLIANKTQDVINKICPKIGNDVAISDEKGNPSTNHKEKQKAFNDITSKTFKTDNCKWGEKVEILKTKGKFSTYDNEYSADSKTAYINVIVPKDRRTEGVFVMFDDTEIILKGYALAMGTVNNNFFERNGKGSTPTGLWSSSYSKTHIGEESYGDHGLIHINGMTGDAKKATAPGKRDGLAIHSGHTTKIGINDNGPLMVTYGCIRVYNADMKKLVEKYNAIKSKSKIIYVYVEEVDSIIDVYKDYDMIADSKDKKRNYSKNAKQ